MLGLVAITIAAVFISTLIFLVPVDPARMTFGQRLDDQTLATTKAKYGLDQSLPVQLYNYLRDLSPINIIDADHLISGRVRRSLVAKSSGKQGSHFEISVSSSIVSIWQTG